MARRYLTCLEKWPPKPKGLSTPALNSFNARHSHNMVEESLKRYFESNITK